MTSVKAVLAISMTAMGASALGLSAYLATHPTALARAPQVEADIVPLSRPRFEFVLANSMSENTLGARELKLNPVIIYGRDAVRSGARPPREVVLQPCSAWRSLASGPASRRVKDLCLRAPE